MRTHYISLRERLRARLEDLVSVSRRSLFGRVIRVPALFPFKRQEAREEQPGSGKRSPGAHAKRKPFSWRRRNNEPDRQMISIDGKQYYVDEDGELKQLNEVGQTQAASSSATAAS